MTDLAALKAILQKTPSYNDQIKGEKLRYYNELYARLTDDTPGEPGTYNYFYNLAQLIFPLRDNHLGFYQVPKYELFKNKAGIDSFIRTKEFLNYPTYTINIDSLKTELAKKHADSIEGIYHYDHFYSIGLFKTAGNEYTGLVVDSDTELWQKGQIAIHLYRVGPNFYKAIYSHPLYKTFILQPNEKYRNQSLVNSYFYASYSKSVYSKRLKQVDYVNVPADASRFLLKNVNEEIQYLKLQTFQADKKTMQASRIFFDSLKSSLKAPNLILDLRNNEGGANKEAKKYLALLKNYVRKGRLYVLVNNGTISQAEIFTLKLKELKHVTTVGQTTKGMLAYGSNYGKRERLPGGGFVLYPTDLKGSAKLLQFEDRGIDPDIILSGDSDWIEQVVEIINR